MNSSLKISIVLLIVLLLVWYIMKTKEHFQKCNGVDKNMDYKYEENKDRMCKNNCECSNTRVCNKNKCVTA
jgi:hypothetical protein